MAVAFGGQTPQSLVKDTHFLMGFEPEYSCREPFNSNSCATVSESGDTAQYPACNALQSVTACDNDDDDEAFHRSEQDLSENPSATSTASSALHPIDAANNDDEAFRRLNPQHKVERGTQSSDSGGPLPCASVTAATDWTHLFR